MMIIKIKEELKIKVFNILKEYGINEEDIFIEKPKNFEMGDLSIPCFNYSKKMEKSPTEIANKLKEELDNEDYEKIEVVGPYLNVFLKKEEIVKDLLNKISKEKESYGSMDIGNNKTIVIDYSAVNIAKPFGIGHLRSTSIGNSIKKIHKKLGYKVIGVNHLGDWGTQFGKLIYAYKTWGNEEEVRNNMIPELKKLYVKFHEEAEKDETLNDRGRECFKKLEDNDEEALKLWQWFKDESLKEFMKTYELLNITDFESYNGESFYIDKTDAIVKELEEKRLLKEDDGAMIVDLGNDIAPALIKRTDGASLYMTRDLAAAFYRKKEYNFDECLYVVGNEQTFHFSQLKEVIKLMGYEWYEDLKHISFGMILENGKKMATRKGTSGDLKDLLYESINLAKKYIEEKSPNLENKDEISRKIGVGAVIFNDLKTYRKNDVDFNLENILKFEGETAPYI